MQLTTLALVALLFNLSPDLWSSVPEELPAPQKVIPDTATELQRKAAILAQQGNKQEADKLMAKVRELLQQAKSKSSEGPADQSLEQQVARFRQELQSLREKEAKATEKEQAEIHEKIARTEMDLQRLRQISAGIPGLDKVANRIRHIRIAAENLIEAGNPDLAAQLRKQADEMERAVRAAKEQQARPEGLAEQVQALRLEVKQLRAEVEELKKQRSR